MTEKQLKQKLATVKRLQKELPEGDFSGAIEVVRDYAEKMGMVPAFNEMCELLDIN